MLLVSYIQQYFNTSITVLKNQIWKLLIALFKVPNTGVFMVTYFSPSLFLLFIFKYDSNASCDNGQRFFWNDTYGIKDINLIINHILHNPR